MVNSCEKAYPRRTHRVVVGEEELELEDAACRAISLLRCQDASSTTKPTFIAAATRPLDYHIEVASIVVVWLCGNPRYWLVL